MLEPRPRRPFGLGAYLLMMLATAFVAGVAGAGVAILGDRPGWVGFGISAAFVGAAMVAGFALCLWWWRGIDEAAREAHKWAWWWGGSGGMAIGAVVLLALVLPHSDTGADATNGDLFAAGMTAILVCQLLGYGIAWAVWWLRHR